MKNLRKVICGVMAVVSIATGIVGVSADETKWETHYVSAQSGLNCRIKSSTEDSEVIKVFPRGTELQVIGVDETGKWYEVWDGETQGYCYGTYFVDNKEDLDKQEVTSDSMVKQKANILVDLRLHTIVRVIHVMAQIVVAQRGQVKLFLVKLLRLTHL